MSVESTTDTSTARISLDLNYLRSLPGICKLSQVAVTCIGLICVQSLPSWNYLSAGGWYAFVCVTGLIISSVLLIFYFLHIVEKYNRLPWLIVETIYALAWAVMFFISGSVAASKVRLDNAWGASTFFGFLGMVIYGYESFRKYMSWRDEEPPQTDSKPII